MTDSNSIPPPSSSSSDLDFNSDSPTTFSLESVNPMLDFWFSIDIDSRFSFIESNLRIDTSKGTLIPLSLTDFQKKWFLSGPLFNNFLTMTEFMNRVCMKNRNAGASYVMIACEAVLTCWLYPRIFIPMIASREEQANSLVKLCKKVLDHCLFDIPLLGGLRGQSKSELSFSNGSTIKAFPGGNPDGIRGPRALCVYCFPGDQKIITDVGVFPIKDIVEKGIGTSVLSLNPLSNTLEWKPILNRIKNPSRPLVKISGSFGSFRCTSDHPIMSSDFRKVKAHSSLNEKVYILNTNSCNINDETPITSVKINSNSGSSSSGNCDGGWWYSRNISKTEEQERLFNVHGSREEFGLFGMETSVISGVRFENLSRGFGLYGKENYSSFTHSGSSGVYEVSFTSGRSQEKDFNQTIFESNGSFGLGGVLHGRRFDVYEVQGCDIEYPRFFDSFGRVNIGSFEYDVRNIQYNSERQSWQGSLHSSPRFRQKKIISTDSSSHSFFVSLQNMGREMFGMWKDLFSSQSCFNMFSGMSKETCEKVVASKSISSIHDYLSGMRKETNFPEEEKKFVSYDKKENLFNGMCEGMEKVTQERLPNEEESVYNIEVADNHSLFIQTSDNKYISCWQCDEMAFISNAQEILSAAEYFISEGGQLSVLSTPWGRNNMYWRIWSDIENYVGWDRHLVTLFTDMRFFDVSKPIPAQIQLHNLQLTCPWLNIDMLEKKRLQDKPFNYANFLQEVCGVPMDEVSVAIPESLLDVNRMDYFYVDRRPLLPDGDLLLPDNSKTYIMSVDFGASNNMTAVVVFEVREGRFVVCYTTSFRGEFTIQESLLRDLLDRFRPNYFIGDATGMGGKNWMDIISLNTSLVGTFYSFDYSKKDFALAVNMNLTNKQFMVERCISMFSKGYLIVPKNFKDLRSEILGVEKLVYENSIKYSGKNGLVGSDDLAMSFFQGCVLFDSIFGMGDDDVLGSVGYNWTDRDKHKKGFDSVPQINRKGSDFVECASVSNSTNDVKRYLDNQRYDSFSKLI